MFNNLENPENASKALEIEKLLKEGNIKLKLILFRHGPKKEAVGEKDELASYFNSKVQEGLDNLDIDSDSNVHITSSPIERAKKTAEIGERNFGSRIKENSRLGVSEKIEKELETIIKYQQKLEEKIKKDNLDVDFDEPEAKQELKNKIDSIILENIFDGTSEGLGKELDLKEVITLTAEDFSENIEEYTKGFLNHLSLLKSKSDKPVSLNVTHSYPIMCFLKNNLKFIEEGEIKFASDMKGRDFLEKVGGCINEAGAISLDYVQSGDRKIIRVSGSNFEGYIDYE